MTEGPTPSGPVQPALGQLLTASTATRSCCQMGRRFAGASTSTGARRPSTTTWRSDVPEERIAVRSATSTDTGSRPANSLDVRLIWRGS